MENIPTSISNFYILNYSHHNHYTKQQNYLHAQIGKNESNYKLFRFHGIKIRNHISNKMPINVLYSCYLLLHVRLITRISQPAEWSQLSSLVLLSSHTTSDVTSSWSGTMKSWRCSILVDHQCASTIHAIRYLWYHNSVYCVMLWFSKERPWPNISDFSSPG